MSFGVKNTKLKIILDININHHNVFKPGQRLVLGMHKTLSIKT